MSAAAKTARRLTGALVELERALAAEDVGAATAALPAVLSACSALGEDPAPDRSRIDQARELIATAIARAEQAREQLAVKLQVAATSRRASQSYGAGR